MPRGRRGARRVDDRRVISGMHAHAAIGRALAGLPAGLRSLHNGLQSLQSLEPPRHLDGYLLHADRLNGPGRDNVDRFRTHIKAHRSASGAKGGISSTRSAARAAGAPQKSTR